MDTAAQPAFYTFKTARKGPRFPSGAVPQRRSREDCLSTEGHLGPLGDKLPPNARNRNAPKPPAGIP